MTGFQIKTISRILPVKLKLSLQLLTTGLCGDACIARQLL